MAKFEVDPLGCWVLKCDPLTWDLRAFLSDGRTHLDGWSVKDNKRARAMAAGDQAAFWVSGKQSDTPPGLWAVGAITAPVQEGVPDEYWIEEGADLYVGIDFNVDSLLVARESVKADPVLARSELITMAQMSNPVMLTIPEWAALQALLR